MTTSTSGNTPNTSGEGEQWVTSFNSSDVLLGRGSGPNDHEGNVLFRGLVKKRKSDYMATTDRKTKAKIAREIVDIVVAKKGRFLKKVDPGNAKKIGIPNDVDVWCPVDEETSIEKAKQALRQKAEKGRGDSPDSPSSKAASVSTFEDALDSMSPETQDSYAHETSDLQGRYSPVSSTHGMHHNESHWNASHPGHRPPYAQSPEQLSHAPPGAFHFEEAPLPQQMSPRYMVELNPERHAKMIVNHNAFCVGDEEVGNGPEDNALENTLRFQGALNSFHWVGSDEVEIFHSYSSNSIDSMGTAESLVMGTSNASMMSISSIMKAALFDTPCSTPRPGGAHQDLSLLFSDDTESSDHFSYDREQWS